MLNTMAYPYTLPPLPYDYDALEPYIDAETMIYHHDRHFQTYINNLNKALEPYPKLQALPLERLLSSPITLPRAARDAIMHNGGGVYNHDLFFKGLSSALSPTHRPAAELAAQLDYYFGSFENFKKRFSQNALEVFGSGWTALGRDRRGALKIVSLKNQETLAALGMEPVLMLDVWEHAYYLKYKNDRAQYVNGAWNVLVLK